MLDAKYGITWSLYHETHSAFFFNVLTSEELEPLKNHFYKQLDNIKRVVALNLNVEQLCVSYLLESLPAAYKAILREALRRLRPNGDNAAFSAAEIRKVFNDTIGVMTDDTAPQNKHPPSFISNYGHPNSKRGKSRGSGHWSNKTAPPQQPAAQPPAPPPAPAPAPAPAAQPPTPAAAPVALPPTGTPQPPQGSQYPPQTPQHYGQQDQPGNNPSYYPRYSFRGRYQGYRGSRGRGNYRGGYGNPYNIRTCYICQDDSKYNHDSVRCTNFPTAALRRQHLEATGRCNCCTQPLHPGEDCIRPRECCFHPGERHWPYLCSGEPHPGRNS